MRAAVRALAAFHPRRVVVAVPLAAAATVADLRTEVDDVVCLFTPEPFSAVGHWYQSFDQTTDAEVQHLLQEAEMRGTPAGGPRG